MKRNFKRTLLHFKGVTLRLSDGREVGPLDWHIRRTERICLECDDDPLLKGLWDVLLGLKKPSNGYLEEVETVVSQSDLNLLETIPGQKTLGDFLSGKTIPPFVWLEGRRRSVEVLADRLGLLVGGQSNPIKFLTPEQVHRLWAFRFMLSQADLLLGQTLFALENPLVRSALGARWADFPGAVLVCGPPEYLPGKADTHLRLTESDGFQEITP